MKALTLWRPWSWAVSHGGKPVENRPWQTSYRGLIAIHAGVTWDRAAAKHPGIAAAVAGLGRDVASLRDDFETAPKGAVVAVAQLVDCHFRRGACCPPTWAQAGCYHFVLRGVVALERPVPAIGRQRFWDLDDDAERAVCEQLAAAERAP